MRCWNIPERTRFGLSNPWNPNQSRKHALVGLIREGNKINNNIVRTAKKGVMIPARCPSYPKIPDEKKVKVTLRIKSNDYLDCPHCFGSFTRSNLTAHERSRFAKQKELQTGEVNYAVNWQKTIFRELLSRRMMRIRIRLFSNMY